MSDSQRNLTSGARRLCRVMLVTVAGLLILTGPASGVAKPSQESGMVSIEQLKPMRLETPIVRGDRPVAVIAVPGDSYAELARSVQKAVLAATGVSLPVVVEDELTEEARRSRTVIAMGNLMISRFAERLYRMNYVHADVRYPGVGGFVVRTVHDPWGSGSNVLFLGGSDREGVARAVARFSEIVTDCRSGTLPQLLEVQFGETTRDEWFARPPDLAKRREGNAKRSNRSLMRKAGEYGLNYALSGHAEWAVAMRDAVFEHRTRPYLGWDDTHMELWYTLIGFDIAEESSALSDEDRLALTQYLLEILRGPEGVKQQTFLGALKEHAIRHNHAMLPALDAYYGGQYFGKYYGLQETKGWLRDAAAIFAGQESASKTVCDATAYESTASFPLPVIYALAEPDYGILSNGTAARGMDRLIGCIDNRMELAGNGDVYVAFPMPLLLMTNYHYRDGRYQWVIDRRRALHGGYSFGKVLRYHIEGTVLPVKPDDAVGVRAYAVDPQFYSHSEGPEGIPEPGRFDKVSFRADFDPDRQYLLLDGLTIGSHGHDDANTIIRFTDLDRVFLVDDSYDEGPNLKDHNGVTVIRNGMRSQMPGAAELLDLADLQDTGFSRTVLRDHGGTDWTRAIIWLKDEYFVIVDEVRANKPGRFDMACLWRTLGDGGLDGTTARTRQTGAEFVLDGTGGDETSITPAAAPFLRFWQKYPHCEPHINVIRQSARRDLKPGDRHTFTNLFYATNERVERAHTLDRSEGSWSLIGGDAPALAGAGLFDRAGLQIDAAAFHISSDRLAMVAGTGLAAGRPLFAADTPVSVELDLVSGECVIVCEADARVGLPGKGAIKVGGVDRAGELDGGLRWVSLTSGRHILSVGSVDAAARVALGAALERLAREGTTKADAPSATQDDDLPGLATEWRVDGDYPVTEMAAFGADGGILVGDAEGKVRLLGRDGVERWRYDLGSGITALHVAVIDGEQLLLAGSAESDLCLLGPDGRERWRMRIPHLDPALAYRAPSNWNDVGAVCVAANAEGQARIVVGLANGWLRCFDAEGGQLWETFGNARGFDQIRSAPMGKDGEALFVVTGRPSHFGTCRAYTPDGEEVGDNGLDGWARVTTRMELDAGSGAVVCGTALGNLYLLKGAELDRVWIKMLGEAVSDLAVWSPGADGDRHILAASDCGYAYRFAMSGDVDWATDLDAPVLAIRGLTGSGVVAATSGGRVHILEPKGGKRVRRADLGSGVVVLEAVDLTGDGADEILVGLGDGSVVALRARD
jgi:hypothetical protein